MLNRDRIGDDIVASIGTSILELGKIVTGKNATRFWSSRGVSVHLLLLLVILADVYMYRRKWTILTKVIVHVLSSISGRLQG